MKHFTICLVVSVGYQVQAPLQSIICGVPVIDDSQLRPRIFAERVQSDPVAINRKQLEIVSDSCYERK